MSRLVTDGRIHPGRIEKTIEKATEEVNALIVEEGERAVLDVGVPADAVMRTRIRDIKVARWWEFY